MTPDLFDLVSDDNPDTPIRARNRATGKVGWYCEHSTTGCEFCYAESLNKRLGTGLPFKPGHRKDVDLFLDETMLLAPLRWKKPRMIFVCSMTDLFADFVPDHWIDLVFAVMALCPQHTFQVLTKRAERMLAYCSDRLRRNTIELAAEKIIPGAGAMAPKHTFAWPLPNVWLGVSAERQQEADERIPLLLQTPAAIRFVSAEPLLGPIDISPYVGELGWQASPGDVRSLDWVIVGGESGRDARPMHPDWARSLHDQCANASVAFFFKQWGEWLPTSDDEGAISYATHTSHCWDRNKPNEAWAYRVGKKAAGRLLDGREHNDMPHTQRKITCDDAQRAREVIVP